MLLGFKKRFAKPIQKGTKVMTIRKRRKVTPKIGEPIYMYSGLRTKHTELISNKHRLTGMQRVDIEMYVHSYTDYVLNIKVDGRKLDSHEKVLEFCVSDGFEDVQDFVVYWYCEHREPHILIEDMVIFHWTDVRF